MITLTDFSKARKRKDRDRYQWTLGAYSGENGYIKYMRDYTKKDAKSGIQYPLGFFDARPWYALPAIGIDPVIVESIKKSAWHKCPYSNLYYYTVAPLSLITTDHSRYIEVVPDWQKEMYNDLEFVKDHYNIDADVYDVIHDNRVLRGMMGSGNTDGFHSMDGHPEPAFQVMEMSNGDLLRVIVWEWFNK